MCIKKFSTQTSSLHRQNLYMCTASVHVYICCTWPSRLVSRQVVWRTSSLYPVSLYTLLYRKVTASKGHEGREGYKEQEQHVQHEDKNANDQNVNNGQETQEGHDKLKGMIGRIGMIQRTWRPGTTCCCRTRNRSGPLSGYRPIRNSEELSRWGSAKF